MDVKNCEKGDVNLMSTRASCRSRGSKSRTEYRGSKICSSSDENFHSDENLRPYEVVKVAQTDKKLTGLGKHKLILWLAKSLIP